jgi:hypothetical protein
MKILWLFSSWLIGAVALLAFQLATGPITFANLAGSFLDTPSLFILYFVLLAQFFAVAGVLMLIFKKRPRFWTSGLALGLTVLITSGRAFLTIHRVATLSLVEHYGYSIWWTEPVFWSAAVLGLTIFYRNGKKNA